jgi:hypothetical protein
MAEWKCMNCGWTNAGKWDKCARCGFPQSVTRKDKERFNVLQERIKTLQDRSSKRRLALKADFESYKLSIAEKWEYLQVTDKDPKEWSNLDTFGKMGWELVGISTFAEGFEVKTIFTLYVFKRRVPALPESLAAKYSDIAAVDKEIQEIQAEIARMKNAV